MGVVNGILNVCAASLIGSALPTHIGIGTSGLTFNSGNTVLGLEFDRNAFTSTDLSQGSQVTFICDFSPTEISGITLREFGTFTTGSTLLNRETLVSPVTFDGTQELQIQQTFRFYK